MYYWRPQIQIHCGKVYNHLESDLETIVHVHPQLPNGGIYHSKFVLLMTTECLRLVIMTTNITNQMVENCDNDYYVVDLPRRTARSDITWNEKVLSQYLRSVQITTKQCISDYEWDNVRGKLMASIPGVMTHTMCWKTIQPVTSTKGRAVIQTTTGQLKYDIRPLFGIQHCTYKYTDMTDKMNWLVYDLETEHYELEHVYCERPFHYKRYIIYYTAPFYQKWIIITSANLSISAWGTYRGASRNTELGIAWNCKE